MNESAVMAFFPRLNDGQFEITSPVDGRYNCIAWAAEDDTRWWWPVPVGGYYWPPACEARESLASFVQAFSRLGYSLCDDGELEPGYQKIALYVDDSGTPTHAARQMADGGWASKLGSSVDISHVDVEGVCGTRYGHVAKFMRRPIR